MQRKPYARSSGIPRRRAGPRTNSIRRTVSAPSTIAVSSISSSSGGAVQTERFPLKVYRNLKATMNPNRVYSFTQAVELSLGINNGAGFTNGTGAAIYGNGMAFQFTLATGLTPVGSSSNPAPSALPQWASFTALFDQYRIAAIEMTLSYSRNSDSVTSAAGTSPPTAMPLLHSIVDYDDATAPTTAAYMLQRSEDNIWQVGDNSRTQKKWLIKPKIALGAYQASAFTGYAQGSPNQWIDTAYPNVQYYGLKLFMDSFPGVSTQLGYATIHCRFFLEFKNVI